MFCKNQWETHDLGIAKHDFSWLGMFGSESTKNIFYFVVFEFPKYRFLKNSHASWRKDFPIEIYQLLLLFSYISIWWRQQWKDFKLNNYFLFEIVHHPQSHLDTLKFWLMNDSCFFLEIKDKKILILYDVNHF